MSTRASLTVTTRTGRKLSMFLPEQAVFEDLVPRQFTPAAGQPPMLLTIVSLRDRGARLKIIALADEGPSVVA